MPVLQPQSMSQNQSSHKLLTHLWLNIQILSSTSMTRYGWGSSYTLAGSPTNLFTLKGWCACCIILGLYALTGPWSQWDFGLKSRGLIARCSLKCKKMPLHLLGGEQCLKILLKLGNFLTSTFFLRDITNYPFCIITVSKVAQVL